MNKKQLISVSALVALVLVVSGIVALLSLRAVFFPSENYESETGSLGSPILFSVVDDLNKPQKLQVAYLVFINSEPVLTMFAEEVTLDDDIFLSGGKNVEAVLLKEMKKLTDMAPAHIVVMDHEAVKIINNSYENNPKIPLLTKDTDFCEILNFSESEFLDQLFAALEGHVESDLEMDALREHLANMQGKSNCYYEVIEK